MYADLHIHSAFSDGTDSPSEVVSLAEKAGLKVISIVDHDTVDGIKGYDKGSAKDLRLIPGVEITLIVERANIHILGYCIDTDNKELNHYLEDNCADITYNTRVNFENAAIREGFCHKYGWEQVLDPFPNLHRISGMHVIMSMQINKFNLKDIEPWDLYKKYFKPDSHHFLPPAEKSAKEAIDIIKKAGGVPIVAHPKLICDDTTVMALLDDGALGLEVFHPSHGDEDIKKYRRIVNEKRLLLTGGSDWHGENNPYGSRPLGTCGMPDQNFAVFTVFDKIEALRKK